MNTEDAFKELVEILDIPEGTRRSYRSRLAKGTISKNLMEQLLKENGYKMVVTEKWKKIK